MPPTSLLGDAELRRRRQASQLLDRPRHGSVHDLVRHLGGVQSQVWPAAGLALRARGPGLTAKRVDRARLRDRSIVVTWAMRGTLHAIAAEDLPWLVPLVVRPGIANAHRRLREEGVPEDQPERAIELIARALERDGPLTRDELRERLRAAGIVTAGQAMAHLTWLASADGGICRGPDRDGTATFVLARDWLRAHPDDPPDPLRELTVRHLRAHGPATAEDLAAWAGISRGTARRGWTSLADRLVEVPTERGPQWRLRSSATREVAAGLVRLLGPFDGYLLGWRDRTLVGSTAVLRRVNRGGGWLHATILVDGRIVGTWALERPGGAVRVAIEPFGRLPAGVPTAIRAEAADLQAFLGTPVEVARR